MEVAKDNHEKIYKISVSRDRNFNAYRECDTSLGRGRAEDCPGSLS